jgi:Family of unknown function (DUF6510)
MSEEAAWLDGNALAGLLQQIFGADITALPRGCQSCGRVNAVGAHRLYRGAGWVLRCPACGDVAMRVVAVEERYSLHLSGDWWLEVV